MKVGKVVGKEPCLAAERVIQIGQGNAELQAQLAEAYQQIARLDE